MIYHDLYNLELDHFIVCIKSKCWTPQNIYFPKNSVIIGHSWIQMTKKKRILISKSLILKIKHMKIQSKGHQFKNNSNSKSKINNIHMNQKGEVLLEYGQVYNNLVRSCIICFVEINNNSYREWPGCEEWFHHSCIQKWLDSNGSCP